MPPPPGLVGLIDALREEGRLIAGWARDPAGGGAVTVRATSGDVVLAEALAEHRRADGLPGFRLVLPAPLAAADLLEGRVRVRALLPGRKAPVTLAMGRALRARLEDEPAEGSAAAEPGPHPRAPGAAPPAAAGLPPRPAPGGSGAPPGAPPGTAASAAPLSRVADSPAPPHRPGAAPGPARASAPHGPPGRAPPHPAPARLPGATPGPARAGVPDGPAPPRPGPPAAAPRVAAGAGAAAPRPAAPGAGPGEAGSRPAPLLPATTFRPPPPPRRQAAPAGAAPAAAAPDAGGAPHAAVAPPRAAPGDPAAGVVVLPPPPHPSPPAGAAPAWQPAARGLPGLPPTPRPPRAADGPGPAPRPSARPPAVTRHPEGRWEVALRLAPAGAAPRAERRADGRGLTVEGAAALLRDLLGALEAAGGEAAPAAARAAALLRALDLAALPRRPLGGAAPAERFLGVAVPETTPVLPDPPFAPLAAPRRLGAVDGVAAWAGPPGAPLPWRVLLLAKPALAGTEGPEGLGWWLRHLCAECVVCPGLGQVAPAAVAALAPALLVTLDES